MAQTAFIAKYAAIMMMKHLYCFKMIHFRRSMMNLNCFECKAAPPPASNTPRKFSGEGLGAGLVDAVFLVFPRKFSGEGLGAGPGRCRVFGIPAQV